MLRNYVLETLGFSSPPRMNQSIHDTLAIISQYQSQRIRESRCYLPSCKCHRFEGLWGLGVMVFNATFNNISVISWRSVLLVGETGVPGENHRSAVSHWQILSHYVISSTPHMCGIRTHIPKRKDLASFLICFAASAY